MAAVSNRPDRHRPRPRRLGELHDDSERLLRMEERLLPLRIGFVAADDVVAAGARSCARVRERRNAERHVVNAGATGLEKPSKESVATGRFEHLDASSALESPLPEAIA